MQTKSIAIALSLAAAFSGCAQKTAAPADVEAAPGGAVATPRQALARVAELRKSGAIPSNRTAVVRFAPGVYELAETLVVSAADGAVAFEGAPGGKTVFSGGRRLGPFTAGKDGIWRCSVPQGFAFEQLWVNDKRAERAKSPNRFYHYVARGGDEETLDPATGKYADMSRRQLFASDPKAVAGLAALPADELADVAIHVWWAWDAEWQRPVAVDAKTGGITLLHPVGRDFFMWRKWMPRFTIENCRTALDAPGEWFLDKKKSELLYVPRAGEKPETTFAVAPALDKILCVKDGARDVSFEGITFAHNGWKLGEGFYAHQSANFATAAMDVVDAARVRFRKCHVTHTANYGLWFGEGAADCSARHVRFDDLGAGGVRIGATKWSEKTPPEKVAHGIVVDDCIIASGGHVFPAGTGVFITYARDCHITHNEICDLYYSGICCGWRWGYAPTPNRDNELSWNHIHHLGKGVLSDMGFIYTLGDARGTIVAGNHGHDMFSYGYTGSGGTGLYPDEGSRGILWTSNLVHHTKTSALSQHYGRENYFHNNIFAINSKPDTPIAGRWRHQDHISTICSNNVFVWTAGHRAVGGPGRLSTNAVSDLVFGSNLWWSPDPIATNAFYGGTWAQWRACGMDAGSVVADPLFRDWKNGDWRLKPDSPAFGVGFKEWNYTFAGVRKEDPAWRAEAAAICPATYEVAPEPPLAPGKRAYKTGFEMHKPGVFPRGAFGCSGSGRQHGYIMCSTRAHKTGKQALEVRDFQGLATRYWPHFFQYFTISAKTFALKFSLKCDAKANFICEWREWTQRAKNGQYEDGPYFTVQNGKFSINARRRGKDGKVRGVSIPMPGYKPDVWCDLEFTLHVPSETGKEAEVATTQPSTWDFAFTDADGKRHEEKDLFFTHAGCVRPNWIGFLSNADCETVTFLDDYSYENRD